MTRENPGAWLFEGTRSYDDMQTIADMSLQAAQETLISNGEDAQQRAIQLIAIGRTANHWLRENHGTDALTQLANLDRINQFTEDNSYLFDEKADEKREQSTLPRDIVAIRYDAIGLSNINKKYGHIQGDAYIVALGAALGDTFRNNGVDSLVGREGGDEFVVYMFLNSDLEPEKIEALISERNATVMDNLSDRFEDEASGLVTHVPFRCAHYVTQPYATTTDEHGNTVPMDFLRLRKASDPKTGHNVTHYDPETKTITQPNHQNS